MVSSGISDVAIAQYTLKKKRLKKLMIRIMIIIMNKLEEMKFLSGRQKQTSAMKLRPEK